MKKLVPVAALLFAAACGGSPSSEETYTIPKGGKIELTIPADKPMHVSFGFELSSDSWKATRDCPEYDTAGSIKIQACGAFEQLVEGGNGATLRALAGGGMNFEPENGEIRLTLTNIAHRTMDYQVTVAPEKTY